MSHMQWKIGQASRWCSESWLERSGTEYLRNSLRSYVSRVLYPEMAYVSSALNLNISKNSDQYIYFNLTRRLPTQVQTQKFQWIWYFFILEVTWQVANNVPVAERMCQNCGAFRFIRQRLTTVYWMTHFLPPKDKFLSHVIMERLSAHWKNRSVNSKMNKKKRTNSPSFWGRHWV